MKRILVPLLLVLALLLSACAKTPAETDTKTDPEPTPSVEPTPEPTPEPEPEPEPTPVIDPNEYTIDREDGKNQITFYWTKPGVDYSKADMWIWYGGADGHGYPFHECAYGGKVVLNVPDTVHSLGYIVRYDCSDPGGSSWGEATKDVEDDLFLDIEGDTVVYLKPGDPVQYTSTDGGKTLVRADGAEPEPENPDEIPVDGDLGEVAAEGVTFYTENDTEDNARVFYEIFVGSFSDSNGDGIGDLRGIINRMDYLNDGDPDSGLSLGVEGIWLTPIFKSTSYHKYNVDDYYTIDPAFGTEDDLRDLIEICHERNVKLILDLVINHTGYYNPWFTAFGEAHKTENTDDPYYDFYCYYSKGEHAPAGRSYSQLPGTSIFYECNFSGDMPELNYDNPAVREAVLDVAKYYIDLGIDGFRFDAAKYVYYGDNAASAEFWKWYMGELRAYKPDIYAVAEVWDSDAIVSQYYPALNCFNFFVSQSSGLICETAKSGRVSNYTNYVEKYLLNISDTNPDAMYLPFVANHDNDRAAGFLSTDKFTMQLAANVYILGPGSPFIYYGEELGMKGSRGGASTDANRRLAMLWGDGDTIQDPTGSTYTAATQIHETAARQKADPDSLYSYYKRLIMIRKANPEIARGEYKALEFTGTNVGGFTATLDGKTVAVIHNTTTSPYTIDLTTLTDVDFTIVAAYIGQGDATLNGTELTIAAKTSCVLR